MPQAPSVGIGTLVQEDPMRHAAHPRLHTTSREGSTDESRVRPQFLVERLEGEKHPRTIPIRFSVAVLGTASPEISVFRRERIPISFPREETMTCRAVSRLEIEHPAMLHSLAAGGPRETRFQNCAQHASGWGSPRNTQPLQLSRQASEQTNNLQPLRQ